MTAKQFDANISMAVSRQTLEDLSAPWMPPSWKPDTLRVVTDTTNFITIDFGDVVLLENRPYLIRNNAREGRFGLDEEVKHWVKRAVDLTTGNMCMVKLVFHEKFTANIAGIRFECFRSPRKEARILDVVKGHPNFMQGISGNDEKGNKVRILEYINGQTLAGYVADIDQDHEPYFFETLPNILKNYFECLQAIAFLHENKEKHGDIRRDHIFIDKETSSYRWIDFDYNFRHKENIFGYDLFGLGNILLYIVGNGDILLRDLKKQDTTANIAFAPSDFNIVFQHRLANLKKVYPYIPVSLNRVLRHFSSGANLFYERCDQLIQDLGSAMADMG